VFSVRTKKATQACHGQLVMAENGGGGGERRFLLHLDCKII